MSDEFSIYATIGRVSFQQRFSDSQVTASINVMVNGMPPDAGKYGPGITLCANDEQQLRALHDWVVGAISRSKPGD